MKIVDTTVAVDHLRGRPEAVNLFNRIVDEEALAASEVVRFELLAGVREDELDAVEGLFSALAWIPVTEEVARTAGALARRFRASHSGIDDADYLVGATAVVLDAELLTTNVRHFPMLKGLRTPY